ncbi:hypothetical protein, partial [Rhizobium leguminosarum]|uniref:hypothetical protein n=1 Tax=Rhizobium leguminosarum TaxID=384 RepID=UPI003F9C9A2F
QIFFTSTARRRYSAPSPPALSIQSFALPLSTKVRLRLPEDSFSTVVNIVTGSAIELAKILAAHNDDDALWAFGSAELSTTV